MLTCHNRQDQTLECLDNLLCQTDKHLRIDVYLVDDGSHDGTSEAVAAQFPSVRLIQGSGSLFWTGGMRLAQDAASEEPYDFFLWLNDDTKLYPNALDRLIKTHADLIATNDGLNIIVGSICDPETGGFTYGGSVRSSRWHPLRFSHVSPTSEPLECIVFNGNCVLLPRAAVEIVGNLHPKLAHAAGDYEYGLRAEKMNVSSWIAPGYLGECPTNSLQDTWKDSSTPLWLRYKKLFSIKGQPPLPRLVYYFNYGGPLWFLLYPLVYFRPIVSSLRKLIPNRAR